jgi:hypothetical protein
MKSQTQTVDVQGGNMKKSLVILILLAALLMILTATAYADGPSASRPCPAPGGGYAGAANMLHDAKMYDTMVAHVPPQGWDGMAKAVENSSCP